MVARIVSRRMEPTGRKIAIAGAGPTGLTCAFYMAMLGHDVTIIDGKAEPGGMLRYALPEYRLPKSVLDREIGLIERLGVQFVFNKRVGFDIPLNELDDSYDAVFIAIGTWKESWVYLSGTELKGVYPALHFLEAVSKGDAVKLGRRVAVIGGGNAAIDSARTALRMGAEVMIIYRRERKDMPAIEEETEAARQEGAKFAFLAAPHRIIGSPEGNVKAIEVVKTKLGEYDSSGRRKPVPTDEIQRFECDTVILAVGEVLDLDFARASGLKIKDTGTIDFDRFTLETSRPRFYAGGDAISGASNVSNAMGYGKKAARMMDERLMGVYRWNQVFPEFEYDQTVPGETVECERHTGHHIPVVSRMRPADSIFPEVVAGLSPDEALEETSRCLRCDVKTVGTH